MNTVHESNRSRCSRVVPEESSDRSPQAFQAQREDLLQAQDRALRVGSLTLLLAFVVALGVVSSRGEETLASSVVESPVVELADVVFPIRVNDRVEDWMHRYLTDQRPQFQQFLDREGLFSAMIRTKLQQRGMPEELVYLAAIESAFTPTATSRVSAAGMWQFMDPTARAYGLRVDEWVDERRDPVRATDAALVYLQELHERFGSWYLAAAAYNAGPNRVARIVRRHQEERWGEEDLYWEIVDQLPRETREYVPKLIAANLLAREAETFGFASLEVAPYQYDQVFVPGGTSLARIAAAMELPLPRLRELNPHLIRGMTPPITSYPVRVPTGRSAQLVATLTANRQGRRTVD